ncbi:5-methylcytosine-specific restriction endonuclease McrA [Bradyrhizobium sp. S3.3.6]|uniref:HNH endonuclease n=1 Tax=Bradyrhizobium sp. S3.3.6 TaxID=3156429 RepID=UPI003396734A
MKPSSITLDRKYAFRDFSDEKSEEWGERLWKLLRMHVAVDIAPVLRDRDRYEYINDRLVNFILARLVTRGVQIHKATSALPEEVRLEQWAEAVSDVLNVAQEVCDDMAWHLSKICPRIVSGGAKLSNYQKRTIKRFARANSHRCYICGQHLEYADAKPEAVEKEDEGEATKEVDKVEKAFAPRRGFEIDHIFAQKRGGGRSSANVAACCEDCNKYKDVLLSYADFPLENAITSSVGKNVKAAFGGRNKFALLWRQSGSCAICGTKFHDTEDERLFLVRRNRQDSYHSMNVDIACGQCGADQSLEGVQLRE